jgi:signal transduction histidine kinase
MFKKLTQLLSKSSNRLLSTTTNILTYSRSEQGSVDVVLMPVDLSELVSDLCSMLEIQAKAKGLTLTKELPPKLMAKVD